VTELKPCRSNKKCYKGDCTFAHSEYKSKRDAMVVIASVKSHYEQFFEGQVRMITKFRHPCNPGNSDHFEYLRVNTPELIKDFDGADQEEVIKSPPKNLVVTRRNNNHVPWSPNSNSPKIHGSPKVVTPKKVEPERKMTTEELEEQLRLEEEKTRKTLAEMRKKIERSKEAEEFQQLNLGDKVDPAMLRLIKNASAAMGVALDANKDYASLRKAVEGIKEVLDNAVIGQSS
jgi:molecular chaperone GrpE (heat shock protein)